MATSGQGLHVALHGTHRDMRTGAHPAPARPSPAGYTAGTLACTGRRARRR